MTTPLNPQEPTPGAPVSGNLTPPSSGGVPPTGGSWASDPLNLTSEDLNSVEVDQQVAAMKEAERVALVREVGIAQEAKGGGTLQAILILTAGGAIGGFIAFLFTRLETALELFEGNAFAGNLIFTFTLAFFIGLAVAMADVIASRNWAKLGIVAAIAVPAAVVSALLLGVVAHLVYSNGTEWIFDNALEQAIDNDWSDQEFFDYVTLWLHPVRGLAWLLVGVSAGITAGAGSRSLKRIGIAAGGGAIGGFLGGFIFDFLPQDEGGEVWAQLIGIVLLGTLIGLAASLVEQAAKSRWIEIVSGGLAGKQFILYKRQIMLGSSPQADITIIKDPAIPDLAAMIDTGSGQSRLSAANPAVPVYVNGVAQINCTITDGDIITLGSSQLRFREKSSDSKIPGALRY